MKKILPLIVMLLIVSVAKAQVVTSFSPDSAVFVEEIQRFMNTGQTDEAKQAVKIFAENWKTAKYDATEQRKINRLANDMIIKRMKPDREFKTYLESINIITSDSTIRGKFGNWIDISRKSLDKSKEHFGSFIEMSYHLFKENAFFVDGSRIWYTSDKSFSFVYDGEPKLVYGNTNIYGRSIKSDYPSVAITNTRGTFDPNINTWSGVGGKTTWARLELDTNKVYAELSNYKIVTTSPSFKADSVLFINTDYFDKPILGVLEDQIIPKNSPTVPDAHYPEFSTYSVTLEIENFGNESVKYIGGFRMKGTKIYGFGDANNKAQFTFLYKGKPFIQAKSKQFVVDSLIILSSETSLEVDMDSGKIYHPQVIMNYNRKKGKVTFERGKDGITSAPFFDTYHNMEIYVDQIFWVIDYPRIEFDMKANDQTAIFESANYFRDFRYEKVQGMLGYNPIDRLFQYAATVRSSTFNIKDYGAYYGSKVVNLMNQFITLADEGYIFFDVETGEVELRDKVNLYRLAHRGLSDYDVLRFNSIIGARSNGSMDLINNHLQIEGVKAFIFSDSQSVFVTPTEQQIEIRKALDVHFAGKISAGRFDFYGKDFLFDYAGFKIKYSHIDSMRIYFPDTAGRGLIPVNSVLQDVYGTLYIDKPNNKSGLKEYSEYPIFVSDKGSNVYYDKPSTFGGIYKRDEFYFKVDPFTIDSLDNFTQEGLEFGGTLYSAGILPDIEYKVSIQNDYSLGFIKHSPAGGWPLYGGKGKGDVLVSLSNRGLWADGEVEYLGSSLKSKKILLLPKEMKVDDVESFDLPESDKYPLVAARNVSANWNPYGDSMTVAMKEEPIKVYSYGYDLKGEVTLMPDKLSAKGTLEWPEATLASNSMDLGPKDLKAESSALKIKTIDKTKFSFESDDVKADVDFEKRFGKFKQNEPGKMSTLTQTKYVTNMPEFDWDMNAQTMDLKRGNTMPPGSTYFMSTHPDQDSLAFFAESALFDIKTNSFNAEGVPYIIVADSKVFPNEGKVVVREDAKMERLLNAKIQADTINTYHNLYEVNTTINSKNYLRGNGKYDYVDQTGKKQVIYMDTLFVNYDKHVEANGYLKDTNYFTIGPKIRFRGTVKMISADRDLYYYGQVLPVHTLEEPISDWFKYQAQIPVDSVMFYGDDPKGPTNGRLLLGLYLNNDSIYSGFYTYQRSVRDHAFMVDTGVMFYNNKEKQFYYGNIDRLLNGAIVGNYAVINDAQGTLKSYGKIDLGMVEDGFKLSAAGMMSKNEKDSVYKAEMALLLDFEWPKKAVEKLVAIAREKGEGSPVTNNQRDVLKKTLYELIHEKNVKKVQKEFDAYGSINLVDELQKMFFLSEVHFYWDVFEGAFVCDDYAGLTSIGNEKIGKRFKTKIRFDKRRTGDKFELYMEFSSYDYIYFNYQRRIMTVFCSDGEFNTLLMEDSDKVTNSTYKLRLGTVGMMRRFIESFPE